jgi:hypothetical protein
MASIAQQARKDTRQAYRPAFKSLNRQERRIRSMDRKQRKDEAAFQTWLRDTNSSLNAEAQKRDAELSAAQQGYQQQIQSAFGVTAQQGEARTAAAGQVGGPGHGGGPQPSYHVSTDPNVRAVQSYGVAQSAAFGARGIESQRRGLELSQSTERNSYAQLATLRAQRRVAVLDALSKVAEQRGDLQAKRAADTAKRQAEIEAAQAEAAQDAFQNNLALERLAQGDARLAQGDARLDLSAQGQSERLRQGRVRNQIARRRLAASGRGGGGATRTPYQRQANQALYDTALAKSRAFYRKARPDGKVKPGDHAKLTDFIMKGAPRGFTRDMAGAVAWQVVGGTVRKGTRKKLSRLGIRVG